MEEEQGGAVGAREEQAGPVAGRKRGEALISQWLREGRGDLTLGGTEAFKPGPRAAAPGRPRSPAASRVRPPVLKVGGRFLPGPQEGAEWGWLSGSCGRWRSWVRQGPQVRERLPPPSTSGRWRS